MNTPFPLIAIIFAFIRKAAEKCLVSFPYDDSDNLPTKITWSPLFSA